MSGASSICLVAGKQDVEAWYRNDSTIAQASCSGNKVFMGCALRMRHPRKVCQRGLRFFCKYFGSFLRPDALCLDLHVHQLYQSGAELLLDFSPTHFGFRLVGRYAVGVPLAHARSPKLDGLVDLHISAWKGQ